MTSIKLISYQSRATLGTSSEKEELIMVLIELEEREMEVEEAELGLF